MKARFGKDIYCQICGKDDKIKLIEIWTLEYGTFSHKFSGTMYNLLHRLIIFSRLHGAHWKFGYKYRCNRCKVKVKEINQSKELTVLEENVK